MESYTIREAAEGLGVTANWLRALEVQGFVQPARRGLNGRFYTETDIALLRLQGIGEGRHSERRSLEEAYSLLTPAERASHKAITSDEARLIAVINERHSLDTLVPFLS